MVQILKMELDEGEAEAIALAREVEADVVLKYLDKSIADVYHLGIQKVQYKKGREMANGKNGNDTRKTYAGNKRKG
jgi:hypothetical protein